VRFDRCLTLSLFRSLNRIGLGSAEDSFPILMYHSVSNDAEEGVQPYYRLATSPARFAEQMQWLRDSGLQGVSLAEALDRDPKSPGRPAVAITFDDGFHDFYTHAWPILKQHGFTATMYLPTAFIASTRKSFRGKECLTWSEVRELSAQGAQFGSHTVNHPKLHELSWESIDHELAASKQTIESELGEAIDGFAYPYAFPQEDRNFTKTLADRLQRLGYQNCATTVVGRTQAGDDPYQLKRLPTNSCDDRPLFAAKLNGEYDWLGSAQRAVRQLKRLTGKSVRRENAGALA
jgi:peptidoglycan/xylan/chitin deacetylase (PgdA/CDA1 family)